MSIKAAITTTQIQCDTYFDCAHCHAFSIFRQGDYAVVDSGELLCWQCGPTPRHLQRPLHDDEAEDRGVVLALDWYRNRQASKHDGGARVLATMAVGAAIDTDEIPF